MCQGSRSCDHPIRGEQVLRRHGVDMQFPALSAVIAGCSRTDRSTGSLGETSKWHGSGEPLLPPRLHQPYLGMTR